MNDHIISPDEIASPESPDLLVVLSETNVVRSTPSHRHARGQLFGATRGLLSVNADHQRWVVPATHAVWIPPEIPHGMLSHGSFAGWSVWVSATCCQHLPASAHVLPVSNLLRECVLRAASWNNAERSAAQMHLTHVILDEIRTTPPVPLGLPMPKDARLLRMARALSEYPNDSRTLENWAHWAGIAPRTLSRKYVAETGLTFTEWRQRVRLLNALELLAAGNSVKAVALDSGYDNVSAFISVFRQAFGVTPGRYHDGKLR